MNRDISLTSYDVGWIILCIGMAIGGSILFLPIQIGLKGIWAFSLSTLIAYPAVYLMQDLYIKTLSEAKKNTNYVSIISFYLGKNFGFILGVAYFFMLLKGIFTYSLLIVNDSAHYLTNFHITENNLSNDWRYILVVILFLIIIASKGEKFLFKISGSLVIAKITIILVISILLIPHWNFENLNLIINVDHLLLDTLLTLPLTLFSILFIQILSPMNISYRKREKDIAVAKFKVLRVNKISYCILVLLVFFFTISVTLTLDSNQINEALRYNISCISLITSNLNSKWIVFSGILLNIFAIINAFFGIYLGVQESLQGIFQNVLYRYISSNKLNEKKIFYLTSFLILIILCIWTYIQFPILLLQQLGAPIYGLVCCLIPYYLILKVKCLNKYYSWKIVFVLCTGILLCITPFLNFFEGTF